MNQTRNHIDPFPAAALSELRSGNKLEAIKILRQQLGVGLQEAKDLVERYVPNDPALAMSDANASGQDPSRISTAAAFALQGGDKIGAIRIVRQDQHIGLKAAKEIVESYLADHPSQQMQCANASAEAVRKLVGRIFVVGALIALAAYYLAGR
jgi:ribosomal protein L7/L12